VESMTDANIKSAAAAKNVLFAVFLPPAGSGVGNEHFARCSIFITGLVCGSDVTGTLQEC